MRKLSLLWIGGLLVSACSESPSGPGDGTGDEPVFTTIVVEATDSSLVVEQTATLSAKGRDQAGKDMALPSQPTFTVTPTSVATVSSNVITGANKGTATVTATVGSVSGTLQVAVSGRIHDADITTSETWAAADNPHIVKGDIAVNGTGSPVLTIEAGTEVRFASGAGLRVGWADAGAIRVMGTAAAGVQFVAHSGSPTKGFWRQLLIYNKAAASEIHYLTMSHCGGASSLGTDACLSLVGSGNGSGPTPVVDHVTVQNSGAYGVRVDEDAAFGAGSTVLSVTGSNANPVTIPANEAGTIPTGGSFTNNTPSGVRIVGEDVTVTQTWANLGVPYVVSSDVRVNGSAAPTLTIPAGLELRFASGVRLYAGWSAAGGLLVQGTQAAPVKFTADAATPAKGHWGGLIIYQHASNATSVTYTTLEYCGGTSGLGVNACVHVVGAGNGLGPAPTLANVALTNSGGYGLRVAFDAKLSGASGPLTIALSNSAPVLIEANEAGTLPAGFYAGNTDDVIEVEGEDVSTTATWKNHAIPYRVLGDVFIHGSSAPVLTIEPGTILRFTAGRRLYVGWSDNGGLVAAGTSGAPITFTAQSGNAGGWGGIILYMHLVAGTKLDYAVVEYAGGTSGLGDNGNVLVELNGLESLITNSTIRHSGACGIVRLWQDASPGPNTDYTAAPKNNAFTANSAANQCGPM